MATTLWCLVLVLMLILILTRFHGPAEAVSSVKTNRVILSYNRGYDICREVTDYSSPESKAAADEACDQAFRALDHLRLNSCHGWRHAACRLIPGDQYYQCTCMVSYCDDFSVKSKVVTPFRHCAAIIRRKEESAGRVAVPTATFQKHRSRYDEPFQAAKLWHTYASYGPYAGAGSSSGAHTFGQAGSSTAMFASDFREPTVANPSYVPGESSQWPVHHFNVPLGRERAPGALPTPHTCDQCDEYFRSARALYDHKRVHHRVSDTHCYMCNLPYKTRKSFLEHLRKKHPESAKEEKALESCSAEAEAIMPYSCSICPRRFSASKSLATHMKMHTTNRSKCRICDKTLSSRWSLLYHMEAVHRGAPIPAADPASRWAGAGVNRCECGRLYSTAKLLRAHQRTHTSLDTYCIFCNQTLGTLFSYRRHMRIKHPDIAAAESAAAMEQYLEAHPQKCKKCNKRFKNPQGLRSHMALHDGATTCDDCGATFSRKSNLVAHKKEKHQK